MPMVGTALFLSDPSSGARAAVKVACTYGKDVAVVRDNIGTLPNVIALMRHVTVEFL
ncbi:hypothetical protein NBRC116601_24240 [Cognatishimia sp. WU-CL00825]